MSRDGFAWPDWADLTGSVVTHGDNEIEHRRFLARKFMPALTQDYLLKHPDGYDDHYLRDFDF